MPKVVKEQRRKYNQEDPFRYLNNQHEVRYSGLSQGSHEERKARFQQDCRDGRIEIACVPSGVNLELYMSGPPSHAHTMMNQEVALLNRDYIRVGPDPTKVQISCHFILNGVCVRWRGWIDSNSLTGQGCLEFDDETAAVEDQRNEHGRTKLNL